MAKSASVGRRHLGEDRPDGRIPAQLDPLQCCVATRGKNRGATSRCTSKLSAALQTPGRCILALTTTMSQAIWRSAERST